MRGKISPAIKQKFTTNDSFAKLLNEPELYQKVQDAMAAELYTALRKDKE